MGKDNGATVATVAAETTCPACTQDSKVGRNDYHAAVCGPLPLVGAAIIHRCRRQYVIREPILYFANAILAPVLSPPLQSSLPALPTPMLLPSWSIKKRHSANSLGGLHPE